MDEEDDRPRRKTGVPVWVWVLLAVGGVGLLGCGGLTVAVVMWGGVPGPGGPASFTGTKMKYSREEFRTALDGKTEDEVMKLLGRPEHTSEIGRFNTWNYREITLDPVSGKIDYSATVWFTGGRVSHVSF